MKKIVKIVVAVFVLIIVGLLAYLAIGQYDADARAVSYTENNGATYEDDYIEFNHNQDIGLIFFTGAKVAPEAYSYLNEVADANIYIVDVAFNFPMFRSNVASKIIDANKDVTNWYVGGHSLGGVVATNFAESNQDVVKGAVLLGSYPQNEITSDNEYLSIYASEDGLVGDYSEYQSLFNESNTKFVEIEGGNHSQFGNYGFQKDDNKSTTSSIEQQQTIVDSIKEFIK